MVETIQIIIMANITLAVTLGLSGWMIAMYLKVKNKHLYYTSENIMLESIIIIIIMRFSCLSTSFCIYTMIYIENIRPLSANTKCISTSIRNRQKEHLAKCDGMYAKTIGKLTHTKAKTFDFLVEFPIGCIDLIPCSAFCLLWFALLKSQYIRRIYII